MIPPSPFSERYCTILNPFRSEKEGEGGGNE